MTEMFLTLLLVAICSGIFSLLALVADGIIRARRVRSLLRNARTW